jgi:hypothetical protein
MPKTKKAAATDAGKDGRKRAKKAKKEAVLIRFDETQLGLIDDRAERMGLSRAAWVRMAVARLLEQA